MALETFDIPPMEVHDAGIRMHVIDPDGNPNRVLEMNSPWKLHVRWYLDGPAVHYMGGSFHVEVQMESMGQSSPDFEGKIADITVPWTDGTVVGHRIAFNADNLPVVGLPPDLVGLFELAAVVTYKDAFDHPRAIAGFVQGLPVQIYNPG